MPGKNCAFPQCSVSQAPKFGGLKLFQIPTRKNEFYSIWRKKLVESISKFRAVDGAFRERVLVGKVYICERHFSEEDFEFTSKLFYFHWSGFRNNYLLHLPHLFPCSNTIWLLFICIYSDEAIKFCFPFEQNVSQLYCFFRDWPKTS